MMKTRGLEGVVATKSSICSINDGVLRYRGYNIDELAECSTFEEIIYLLWYGRLPLKDELMALKQELNDHVDVPSEMFRQLKAYPIEHTHPMSVLRSAVSTLGIFDAHEDEMNETANKAKALRLQAKISTIVAGLGRVRQGKEPIPPRHDLSFAANFLYMLNGELPSEIEENAFNRALVLHADHELNASTFTARVCVATLSDVYSGITAAIGALKGSLHGGANGRVMKMLEEIGSVDRVEAYVDQALKEKRKIMGFGHRVYKNGDPRAKHLKDMSYQLTRLKNEPKWYDISIKLADILRERKGLLPNVDFYSASVYHCLGIENELFTPIFAVSRTAGWIAHIFEQYNDNRLIRPRALYIGPESMPYIPIEERNKVDII
ncbi:citrate synthase [Terrilactibacillus sp. BCM23-1]|uniref:Citrate synthase n=1 Tax=Terrilactibacillus tamarindi TaxID=2599694 RepID=A0A6N8CNG7_9BACI|nr:citrate synthase [Terrilactibacillus tamarindi]MTT31669.1 citrate synthase [Terrilactibacillus tamarindi]